MAADASREFGLYFRKLGADSSHLIPEARNRMPAAVSSGVPAEEPAAAPAPAPWKLSHRFASGTRLYFDPTAIGTMPDGTRLVSARYQLARKDLAPYIICFIRFQMKDAAEVQYDFEINCVQHIYETNQVSFSDKNGQIIGEQAFLDGTSRTALAVAAQPSILLVVQRQAFSAVIQREPHLGMVIMRNIALELSSKLRKANTAIAPPTKVS